MKYNSVGKDQWLYQKPKTKYYDCGIRAVLNAYMFWHGYDPSIKNKLQYYRKRYGPYPTGFEGEMEDGEVHHLAQSLGLSLMVIVPTETGINGVLRYHLPVMCQATRVMCGFRMTGPHAFLLLAGWNGVNVYNTPVHKLAFADLQIPQYEVGKPWQVIHTVVPKEFSIKNINKKVGVDSSSLFRIISESIYQNDKYM